MMVLMLMLTNSVGAVAAYRHHRLRREEFAVLMNERSVRQHLETLLAEHARLESSLEELAETDALTGTMNRRSFLRQAEERLENTRRKHLPVALIFLDLDDFKQVNDHYGHAGGDAAIAHVARLCGKVIPDGLLGRVGGDEFALLLENAAVARVVGLAEDLRRKAGETPCVSRAGIVPLTLSIGIAFSDDGSVRLDALLSKADRAQYQAKAAGKNRVVLFAGEGRAAP